MISRRSVATGLACAATAALSAPMAHVARAATRHGTSPDEARALHALNRLAYGPRPEDVVGIRRVGAQAWLASFIESQLEPQA